MKKITTQLNRLRSQKAVLENNLRNITQRQRRARTRTLIQMGGLLNLTDLPALSRIDEGDDLQMDISAMDKAATLLGMILSLQETLPQDLTPSQIEAFKKIGIRHMKMHTRKA